MKKQKFEKLGLELTIYEETNFYDAGYQDNLISWIINTKYKKEQIENKPYFMEIPKFKKVLGYYFKILRPESEIQIPDVHIAYKKKKNTYEDTFIRGHEEAHAATTLIDIRITNQKLGLLGMINEQIPIANKCFEDTDEYFMDAELIANIGGIFALIKSGLTKEESLKTIVKLLKISPDCPRLKKLSEVFV